MTMIASVGACVSILTLVFVAYREFRESNARAEQRAKATIELLRIAETPTEPDVVREFAKRELRRMRAQLVDKDEEKLIARVFSSPEKLIAKVFSSRPLDEAREQLLHSTPVQEDAEPLDADTERLLAIVNWWKQGRNPPGLEEEARIRIGMVLALQAAFFIGIAIVAVQRVMFSTP